MTMRKYPHKPNEGLLAEIREETRESYESDDAYRPRAEVDRRAEFFKGQADTAMEVAALEYAFEGSPDEVIRWLDAACRDAETAVEFGIVPDPGLYMTYLSLANLCGTDRFRQALEGFDRARYTNPNVGADEAFYLAAEAMSSLSAGAPAVAAGTAGRGLARLRSGVVNRYAREATEALLLLEEAIAQRSGPGIAAGIRERHEENRRSYSDSAARNMPGGLLDVVGLGLLRLAHRHGLAMDSPSVYLPAELALR